MQAAQETMSAELERGTGEEDTLKDKFLTFRIAEEDYGVEIRYVTEIVGVQSITKVPDMPGYIRGVINLRGRVIPVMDVRTRFGMALRDYDERTCIIVVQVKEETTGLIVDRVNEVLDIDNKNIEPAKSSVNRGTDTFVMGLGKVCESVKVLLDVDRLVMA